MIRSNVTCILVAISSLLSLSSATAQEAPGASPSQPGVAKTQENPVSPKPTVETLPEDELNPFQYRIGLNMNLSTSFGVPAQDAIGGQLYAAYRVTPSVWGKLSLSMIGFDVERPLELLPNAPLNLAETDTTHRMFDLALGFEWHLLDPRSRLDIYLGAGFGMLMIDTDRNRDTGTPTTAATDVETRGELGSEIHVEIGAAFRVIEGLHITLGLKVVHVFSELEIRDVANNRKTTLSSFDLYGFNFGLEYRF